MSAPEVAVRPSRDLKFFDSVLRNPEVYAGIADETTPPIDEITLAALVRNPHNLFLEITVAGEKAGFFALLAKAAGIYEVHTNLLPRHHGSPALQAAKVGMDWMFLMTDATILSSFAWSSSPAAAWIARAAGMKLDGRRPYPHRVAGAQVDIGIYSIDVHEWLRLASASPAYEAIGQRFHDSLFAQQEHENHPEDAAHNGVLGVVLVMGTRGQPYRAELLYNRWAAINNFAPAAVLHVRGGVVTLDIANAVVEVDRALNVTLIERKS